MNLSQLTAWAIAHPESAALALTVVATSLSSLYATVKVAYQRVTGRAAKGGAWTVFDVLVELLPNLPGALNRLGRAGGSPSIFAPPAVTPPSPSKVVPVDHSGERGSVRVGTLVAISGALLVATLVGVVLAGCPAPRLPAVEGCTALASRCHNDTPQVCSSTGRWHDVGDLTCARSGGVCAEGVDGGVAHCAVAPLTDGGSDAR